MSKIDTFKGFTPSQAAQLLNVHVETLGAWRESLEPSNKDKTWKHYDPTKLLCYRVVKCLRKQKFLPLRVIKEIGMEPIFKACKENSLQRLDNSCLVIHAETGELFLKDTGELSLEDHANTVLVFRYVLSEHKLSLIGKE